VLHRAVFDRLFDGLGVAMFKLTALLCAAMFAVFLIAGEDRGQLRPGLASAALVTPVSPPEATASATAEAPPVLVAAAATDESAAPSADVAPVDTPVTMEQVTTPETAAEIASTVFSLADYGDQPASDQTASASSENVGDAAAAIGYVDADEVNVREGPGTGNAVLTRLGRGEAVTIVSTDASGWARVRIEGDGLEGFISTDYLSSTP
jgi:Bacterial SH3 domain